MSIYIYKNNVQYGPFAESQVLEMLKSGQLSPDDPAFRPGQDQWQPLRIVLPGAAFAAGGRALAYDTVNQVPPRRNGPKVWLFALIGLFGFVFLTVIGLLGFFVYLGSRPASAVSPSGNQAPPVRPETKPPVRDFKAIQLKAEEFARMSPPKRTETAPLIKGKVAIVEKGQYDAKILGFDYEGREYSETDIERFGISKVRLAVSPAEIDTLIQILCRKGKLIGYYEGGIPGYANDCKVSVIDYKAPAVIAAETYTNSTPPPKISSVYKEEFIFPAPREVEEFIGNLPLEKLPGPLADIAFDDRDGYYGKYKPFMDLAGELSRAAFPVKLDPNASIKGKVAVALKTAEGRTEMKGFDVYGKEISTYEPERWGITGDRMAASLNEIDTLIQINCRRGERLGSVKKTAVFSNRCEISVVDYKSSIVIFQKKLENNEMERDVDTEVYPTRYIVLYPTIEIDEFIKGLPKA